MKKGSKKGGKVERLNGIPFKEIKSFRISFAGSAVLMAGRRRKRDQLSPKS